MQRVPSSRETGGEIFYGGPLVYPTALQRMHRKSPLVAGWTILSRDNAKGIDHGFQGWAPIKALEVKLVKKLSHYPVGD